MEFWATNLIVIPMPTALIRIYTPDGFVVAADGRSTENPTNRVITDEAQKIFRLGRAIAASLCGSSNLVNPQTHFKFDFVEELLAASQPISPKRYQTLQDYAGELAHRVNRNLELAQQSGNLIFPSIPAYEPEDYGDTITIIWLNGYHNDRAASARVRLSHEGQRLLAPSLRTEPLLLLKPFAYGIQKIADMLVAKDRSVVRYLNVDVDTAHSLDLRIALTFSSAFIDACGGPEAMTYRRTYSRRHC